MITPSTITTWAHRMLDRVDRKIEADQATGDRRDFQPLSRDSLALWRRVGSAGRAREWLAEALMANPHDPYAVVAQLEARIETEVAASPRRYSVSHLYGVAAIAREEAGL
jgi:hypothetical protein